MFYGRSLGGIIATQGHAIDSAIAFQKIKGEKLATHHPEDRAIPESASLQKQHPLWCYDDQNGKSASQRIASFLFGARENKESLTG